MPKYPIWIDPGAEMCPIVPEHIILSALAVKLKYCVHETIEVFQASEGGVILLIIRFLRPVVTERNQTSQPQ